MPFDLVSSERAERFLQELYNVREKLIYQLSGHGALGNLEEKHLDDVVRKLAAVQGCIEATEQYGGKT